MEKNWLIRTHDFQILGPISKEKLLELVNANTLHRDDEICSGNGYWFFYREKDLLQKYVLGSEKQGFNPVQESNEEVIPMPPTPSVQIEKASDKLPEEDDLEYPSLPEVAPPPLEIKKNNQNIEKKIPKVEVKKSILNDKFLFLLVVFFFVLAIFAFYFRKRIMENFLNTKLSISYVALASDDPISFPQKKNLN